MNKKIQDTKSPIFIHSLFRSGSTYMFNVFRRSTYGYWCYQEPLNEHLLYAASEPERLLEYDIDNQQYLRHPEMSKPYFYEFHTIADEVGKHFHKELSYDQYFSSENKDSTSLENYFTVLLKGSQGRPLFQCCRTAGRVERLKSEFNGAHIFLWRNPWDQWWSYKVDAFFDRTNLLIANSVSAPMFIKKLCDDLSFETIHSSDFWTECTHMSKQRLDAAKSYMLFYALWCHAMLEARPHCDVIINIDQLSTNKSYREEILVNMTNLGIKELDYSDCGIPVGVYGKKDTDFFNIIEVQVHDLLLDNGYSKKNLDEVLMLRHEFSIARDEIKNAEKCIERSAEQARYLALRNETELADVHHKNRIANAVALQADARAQQAETKTQQADARAQQAETKTQQENARSEQAETRAEQAESRAQQLHALLHDVYTSRSWKITAPWRWAGNQIGFIHQDGLLMRIMTLIKKVARPFLRNTIVFIDSQRSFRSILIIIVRKLRIYGYLKTLYERIIIGSAPIEVRHLTPNARRIYADLKAAMSKY